MRALAVRKGESREESWFSAAFTWAAPDASIERTARRYSSRVPEAGSGAAVWARRVSPGGRGAPVIASISGLRKRCAVTMAAAGLPGRPRASREADCENQVGLPGFTAIFSKTGLKAALAKAVRTTS